MKGDGDPMDPQDNLLIHSQLDRFAFLSSSLDSDPSDPESLPPSSVPPAGLVISEESRHKRDQTLLLIDAVENRRQEIETSLHLIDLMETDIQSSSLSQRDQIISLSDQLKREAEQQIEQHKQILLQQLEDKNKEKLDRLSQQRKQLERDLDCLDNSVSFSRSLIKNATDDQLESHLPRTTEQLLELKEDRSFNAIPSETRHIQVTQRSKVNFEAALDVFSFTEVISNKVFRAINESKRTQSIVAVPEARVYRTVGLPRAIIGTKGREDGQFVTIRDVATNRYNNIIAVDPQNHRVQIFDADGKHLMSFGSQGSEDGEFDNPVGVAVDPTTNNIIVSDFNHDRLQIFDEIGRHIKTIGSSGIAHGSFRGPCGIAVQDDGSIIVCEWNNSRVQIIDSDGVFRYFLGQKGRANGQFEKPSRVCVGRNGNIIVCDSENHRVQVFSSRGNHLRSFGTKGAADGRFNSPNGIAVDHQNNIIVCDQGNQRMQVFDEDGRFIRAFGSRGSAPGLFYNPRGVVVDSNNRIIVSDSDNQRLQIF